MKVQEKRAVEKQNSSMPYSSKMAAFLFTVPFLFYFIASLQNVFLTFLLFIAFRFSISFLWSFIPPVLRLSSHSSQ